MEKDDWDWTRRWTARDLSSFLTRSGLCVEGVSDSAQTFDQIQDKRLLVLLGEPGSGKSYEAEKIRDSLDETGENVLFLDGKRAIHSDASLIRLWINSPEWQTWRGTNQRLTLIFDAFDESRSRVSNLSGLILDELRRQARADAHALERLRFWILSRPVGWDFALGADLVQLFYPEAAPVDMSYQFRLLPPRRSDVTAVAEAALEDPTRFLQELSQRNIWPLTARPKNLRWLLGLFMERGQLPDDQVELFRFGVMDAASDTQFRHREEKDVAIASRIAFAFILSESTSIDTATLPSGDSSQLNVWQLKGHYETSPTGDVPVTREELHRAVQCGLFSAISDAGFVWSHQTYPEFLAGDYLAGLSWPVEQKASLLSNPLDPDQHILRQFTEVAAWAAAIDVSLMHELLQRDPEQLLLSDVAFSEGAVRERLCEAFLDGLERGSVIQTNWYLPENLQRLSSQGLGRVLRPNITNRSLKTKTRDIAIQIAHAAEVRDLVEIVLEVALCRDEEAYLRSTAAYMVRDLGTPEERIRLLDLLLEDAQEFEQQNLRGCALQANWPDQVPLSRILDTFVVPLESALGAYQQFIHHQFLQNLPTALIPDMFEWWSRQTVWSRTAYDAERFDENLLDRAISDLESSRVRASFVSYLVDRVTDDHILFRRNRLPERLKSKFEDFEIRHRVIGQFAEELIAQQSEQMVRHHVADLYGRDIRLVSADIEWLKIQVLQTESHAVKRFWLNFLIWCELPESLESLWQLSPQLQEEGLLREALGPVDTTSVEAEQARESWKLLHCDSSNTSDDDQQVTLNEMVSQFCQLAEDKHSSWWWKIDEAIQSQGHNHFAINTSTPSTTLLPAWIDLKEETKQRVVGLALPFLRDVEIDDENEIWWSQPALAAVRAIGLLSDLDSPTLAHIEDEVWRSLGPAFACFGVGYEFRETQYISDSLGKCIEAGFDSGAFVIDRATRDNQKGSSDLYNALKNCRPFWSQDEVDQMFSSLISGAAPISAFRVAFGALDDVLTPSILDAVLTYADTLGAPIEEVGPLLASALICGSDQAWAIMKPRLEASSALLQSTLYSVNEHPPGRASFSSALSVHCLGELYVLAVNAFPPADDGHRISGGFVTPRQRVGMLRDELLRQIVQVGSWEAVAELERIQPLTPEVTWLGRNIAEAKDNARTATMEPLSVETIMTIVESSAVRIVRSDAHLKQVVLDEIAALEARLQGESRRVYALWNVVSAAQAKADKVMKAPKQETLVAATLRDFLRDELARRHVLYNREVENTEGDEIDALFQHQDPQTLKIVTVPCEIKCCYNAEVLTAMEGQLFERYMKGQGHSHGIYLVPFFDCPSWTRENYERFHHAPKGHLIEELKEQLDSIASELSVDGFEVTAIVLDCRLQ